jgi:basic membrane protein A
MNGTWKTGSYWGGLADGFTAIAPFGKSVPASVQKLIAAKKAALISGKFYEFQGPLYDQTGKLRVPAGKRLTLNDILGMNWFVKGVIGKPSTA